MTSLLLDKYNDDITIELVNFDCDSCNRDLYIDEKLFLNELAKIYPDIKKLKQENEKLRKCVEFYANDGHIRDYGNGQQVILESFEVQESESGECMPNKAQQALEKIGEK